MNKRLKLKKGILHKACNDKCYIYKIIDKEKLITNNCCIGCKFRYEAYEKMCLKNREVKRLRK